MQRLNEENSTPPPPYTLVDQNPQLGVTSHTTPTTSTSNNSQHTTNSLANPVPQYHSQNPYPATVIQNESDFRLAQKLQDQEYALLLEQQQRAGESSTIVNHARVPIPPPIQEHCPYNHYQNNVVYASPNQPPLPYTQSAPYASGPGDTGTNNVNHSHYGSVNQGVGGYYQPTQNHPFYNASYYNYERYRSEDEEAQGCLNGLYERFSSLFFFIAMVWLICLVAQWVDF